ncbi:hypothetical protein ACFSSA_11940 [Luteolibacter algae]|uniref:ABC transporter permease n=1 Tax=Luteolibacter algae TaxID=454151 RepID=A0ABW5DAD6_9BACT
MDSSLHTNLPERLGAITVKELRQSLRRTSFIYPFIFIHIFATTSILVEFQLGSNHLSSGNPAVLQWEGDKVGYFWWIAMSVCGLLMPLAGFFLMPQETDEGNHELLLLASLSRWQIVFEKFLMLWGLSLLTFVSLLPYIIIRYFIGGIEWLHELANSGTVLAVAAIIAAASLAASGFKHMAAKASVFILFLFCTLLGGGIGMIGPAMVMDLAKTSRWLVPSAIFYHLCAVVMVSSFCFIGLLVARSRLRLAVMNFEVKPSSLILIMLGVAPFIIGAIAACTCGFGSILGVLLIAYLAWNTDRTPKAPKSFPAPAPNIPLASTNPNPGILYPDQ